MIRSLARNLSAKVLLIAFGFLALVAILTGYLINNGFQITQNTATQRSIEGFERESRTKLSSYTAQEAALQIAELDQVVQALAYATRTMQRVNELGLDPPWTPINQLARTPEGSLYDSRSTRTSDIFIPPALVNANSNREIQDSAILDAILPDMLASDPDAVAIYYTGATGAARYYPPIDLHLIIPADFPVLEMPWNTLGTPDLNPQRTPFWLPPAVDPAGQGLLLTVGLPLYSEDTFRGTLSMDISLNRLIERINSIKTTPGGAAFLLDSAGHLIAAAPGALPYITNGSLLQVPSITTTLGLDLTAAASQPLRESVAQMRTGTPGIAQLELNNQPIFISYAPVTNVGWYLALITPISEVSTQAQSVTAAIQSGTRSTVRDTLLAMGLLFLIALVGVAALGRQVTRPIISLSHAVSRVAEGQLDQHIATTSKDEIGELQHGFNQMLESLRSQKTLVEDRNTELSANLARQGELLETIQQLSLPLLPVLEDVVVLPLIGHMDAQRGQELQHTLLAGVAERRSRIVILDITGLTHIDQATMELLVATVQALRLLGAQVVLAGISAQMARFIVTHNIQLGAIESRQNLQQALEFVLNARQHLSGD